MWEMTLAPTLLLSRDDVATLMTPDDYLSAVREGFRAGKDGRAQSPPPLHITGIDGGFHAKGSFLDGTRKVVAVKLNGNFPGNPGQRGLPTIQGAILLCDAENGVLLAILDSIEITLRRTAGASALAASYLAQPGVTTLAICGCGSQAAAQADAIAAIFPIRRGFAWDIDLAKAQHFAEAMGDRLGFGFEAVPALASATLPAQIIITCTTAQTPFLSEANVSPGAFIAAVGADSPDKSEIAPSLMARGKVVTDVTDQCLDMGDLHHAVAGGAMTATDVYCDLGDLAAGLAKGRTDPDDIFIFDSTGTALQDVASALVVYQRATAQGVGQPYRFA
jgi:alanine dehydrogenase